MQTMRLLQECGGACFDVGSHISGHINQAVRFRVTEKRIHLQDDFACDDVEQYLTALSHPIQKMSALNSAFQVFLGQLVTDASELLITYVEHASRKTIFQCADSRAGKLRLFLMCK